MATIFLEPGTDATQDLSFFNASTGTVSSDTGQSHTGPRSLKMDTSNPAVTASATSGGSVLGDAGRRISFYFRCSALPTADTILFSVRTAAAGNVQMNLLLKTTGVLNINTGASNAAGTTVLAIATWYRITFSYTITNTTTHSVKVYLNGVQEVTETNSGTLTATGSGALRFTVQSLAGINVQHWFDDIYVDNASDLSDPGDIRVTAKRAFSNGTTNGFVTQIGAGGSGYGTGHAPQVNEQPLSTTDGWSIAASGSAVTEEYNVEGRSVGDVDLSRNAAIKDIMGWVSTSALIAETGQIIVNGVSTAISVTTSAAIFMAAGGSSTYPAGTGADIGMSTDTTVTTVSLFECGILIAYEGVEALVPAFNPTDRGEMVGQVWQ